VPANSKKTLLSVFACDPNIGSEPMVGWNWLKLLSENTPNLVVLTRKYHEIAVEVEVSRLKIEGITLVCFDLPFCEKLDHRSRFMKAYYVLWQIFAPLILLTRPSLLSGLKVIHHVTYCVVDFPGILWAFFWIAFVWGPIGGGQCPPDWAKKLYGRGWRKQTIRRAVKRWTVFNPFVWGAGLRASLILVANLETMAVLPKRLHSKCRTMLDTTVDIDSQRVSAHSRDLNAEAVVRFLWAGRLEPRKGLQLVFDAIVRVNSTGSLPLSFKLTVVGDGPQRGAFEKQVAGNPLLSNITLAGGVPLAAMQSHYENHDVFLFSSVQDTSGTVVLEALSFGLPVIAIDHQGAGLVLRGGGGALIRPASYDDAVSGFSKTIVRLSSDRREIEQLKRAALSNVLENHTFVMRRTTVARIYDEIFAAAESV
jgi:glycosyltransferase involved in cell wall biosynthesis